MKKILLALLVVVMLPCLTFGAETKSIKVGFVISALNEPIFQAYQDYVGEAVEAAGKAAGYEIEYVAVTSDGAINQENANVKDMISAGCNYIVLNTIDSKACFASIEEAHAAGVKVIMFCREADASATGSEKPDATVNMDSYDQAYTSMKRTLEYMKQDGVEVVNFISIMGYMQDQNAINRQQGVEDACKEAGIKIATTVSCGQWDPSTALTNLTTALQTYPDSNFVYTPSDSQLPGVQTALERAGKWAKRGEKNHVYLAGTDVFPDGYKYIAQKYEEASTENPVWLCAEKTADIIITLEKGEKLAEDGFFKIKGRVFDQENYKTFDHVWAKDYSGEDLKVFDK
ncbi:MAG: sugar ABC transporter substrate-binding protein [Synergistaceae bacterium]|jgi:D-xylose transport system substrate-binding protein|nr:sugar ABC transporter substrate-binding protein [Synergistaceae bacterium]